jgi:hypothetical protein
MNPRFPPFITELIEGEYKSPESGSRPDTENISYVPGGTTGRTEKYQCELIYRNTCISEEVCNILIGGSKCPNIFNNLSPFICANLETDPRNCGQCRRICASNVCDHGECRVCTRDKDCQRGGRGWCSFGVCTHACPPGYEINRLTLECELKKGPFPSPRPPLGPRPEPPRARNPFCREEDPSGFCLTCDDGLPSWGGICRSCPEEEERIPSTGDCVPYGCVPSQGFGSCYNAKCITKKIPGQRDSNQWYCCPDPPYVDGGVASCDCRWWNTCPGR